jgi:hypothetical protein
MSGTLAAGDREGVRRLAHKLAGSFSLYGFAWAAAESRAIQRESAAGDLVALGGRCEALRAHLEGVRLLDKGNHERAREAVAGG